MLRLARTHYALVFDICLIGTVLAVGAFFDHLARTPHLQSPTRYVQKSALQPVQLPAAGLVPRRS